MSVIGILLLKSHVHIVFIIIRLESSRVLSERASPMPAGEDASAAEPQVEAVWTDDGSLPLDGQGQLPFFLLDAHEEVATPGLVYLFGKVTMHSAAHDLSSCMQPVMCLLSGMMHKP